MKDDSAVHFDLLFTAISNPAEPIQNLTRAGYVQKIITSLLTARPNIFLPYIFRSAEYHKGLTRNANSKSVQTLLLLITMCQSPTVTFGAAVSGNETDFDSVRKSTLAQRLELFSEILKVCLEPVDDSNYDNHISICDLSASILNKEFQDRGNFLELFRENFFQLFLENFLSNFHNTENKSFSVLFSFLEDCEKAVSSPSNATEQIEIFSHFAGRLLSGGCPRLLASEVQTCFSTPRQDRFKSIAAKPEDPYSFGLDKKFVSTFSLDIKKMNSKLIKTYEVVRVIYKQFLDNANFDQSALETKLIAFAYPSILHLHPQSNFLHSQILKLCLTVIDTKNEALFATFFTENKGFISILEGINSNTEKELSSRTHSSRPGFFGHLKLIVTQILESSHSAQFQANPTCLAFVENFYNQERKLETYCLGDVDIKAAENEMDITFFFTPEEVLERYKNFLGYTEQLEAPPPKSPRNSAGSENMYETDDPLPTTTENDQMLQELASMGVNVNETGHEGGSRAEVTPTDLEQDPARLELVKQEDEQAQDLPFDQN